MEAFFWLTLFGAGYSYFIYPLLLLLLPPRGRRGAGGELSMLPSITLIITARNERRRIAEKLRNTLALDYPQERLEIIVASDASDDGTDEVVGEFAPQGVRLVRAEQRHGKEYAQWLAIRQAAGEVLVFSDVATRIDSASLQQMARDFSDPEVGAVSSEDRFLDSAGRPAGEGAYVRYEMALRRLESRVSSLVGLSGSFFAVRRVLCRDWDTGVPSDFNTAFNCIRQGFRAIADPQVLGFYPDLTSDDAEYRRKLRTAVRGMAAVASHPQVLDPRHHGLFAFQVWSHKVMRWAVPWFMLPLLAANLLLVGQGGIYDLALVGQGAFYGAAVFGYLLPSARRFQLIRIPFFFTQVNLALAHAAVAFLFGRRITVWEPSQR